MFSVLYPCGHRLMDWPQCHSSILLFYFLFFCIFSRRGKSRSIYQCCRYLDPNFAAAPVWKFPVWLLQNFRVALVDFNRHGLVGFYVMTFGYKPKPLSPNKASTLWCFPKRLPSNISSSFELKDGFTLNLTLINLIWINQRKFCFGEFWNDETDNYETFC